MSHSLRVVCIFPDLFKCFLYFANCPYLELEKQIFPLNTSHQYAHWSFNALAALNSKDQKKNSDEKRANYCLSFSENTYVRNLEVWSRRPRRINSRRCADSLRDNRAGHEGCWRTALWLPQAPNLRGSSMLPGFSSWSTSYVMCLQTVLKLHQLIQIKYKYKK